MTCHTANADFVLGATTWHLNGDLTYPSGITDNQLNTWLSLGMFANPFAPEDINTFLQSKHISDNSASLETRVRSYLDSNCSSCHRPGAARGHVRLLAVPGVPETQVEQQNRHRGHGANHAGDEPGAVGEHAFGGFLASPCGLFGIGGGSRVAED